MQIFPECPPWQYLYQIAVNCPTAVATYMRLWQHRDDDYLVKINPKTSEEIYDITTRKFRHDLSLLAEECLLNVYEQQEHLVIELVAWGYLNDSEEECFDV